MACKANSSPAVPEGPYIPDGLPYDWFEAALFLLAFGLGY